MQKYRGFTLIELISLIVILGILAATATPRFISLGAEARIAAVKTLEGTLRSMTTMAHMACATQSICRMSSQSSSIIKINGKFYSMLSGYPIGGTSVGVDNIDALVSTGGFSISTIPFTTTTKFSYSTAPTPANCAVSYSSAVDANTPPVITSVTSGC